MQRPKRAYRAAPPSPVPARFHLTPEHPISEPDDNATNQRDGALRTVFEPKRNCWQVAEASRAAVIVDTADYFQAFADACRSAQRQILILGWDFDRRERLFHDGDDDTTLGDFLIGLTRDKPDLNVYLLSWDFNMIYAAERELLPALRLRLKAPRRFHFRLDGKHPGGASHHQKLVVIDDRIAFCGGIDLSRWRWDTSEHAADDPRRIDPNGKPYPPFHDMMFVVEGEVAARLGDLARARWRRSRGWQIRPPHPGQLDEASPWPEGIDAEFEAIEMAIARTAPAYRDDPEIREVERLHLDAIASARRFVYIENQYFTSKRIADALVERLAADDPVEVVLVLPEQTGGWLEQVTMDVLRGRVVDTLKAADEHDRLRIYYPHQPGLGEACISVHAKLLIVDDRVLRIGSSNLSNRSMGLDTECDLALAAGNDAERAAIRSLRRRLLAEHLGCEIDDLDRAENAHDDALIPAIESLRGDGRSLRDLDTRIDPDVDDRVPDDAVIDPSEPFSPNYFVSEYVPNTGRPGGRKRLIAFLVLIAALLALAAAWRWTPMHEWLNPERLRATFSGVDGFANRIALGVGAIAVAALAMVPITLLAIVSGIVFDHWVAFSVALLGALLASAIGFLFGQLLGGDTIERMSGSRVGKLSKRLADRGTIAVALLRLIPVAPFAVFNLIAGASHLGFRQFAVGSLLGLAPGLGAITLFSNSLWATLTDPSWERLAATGLLAAVLIGFAMLAKRWLRSG